MTLKSSSKLLRSSLILLSFASLAGCAATSSSPRIAGLGGSGGVDPRYGVRASPRVVADGEDVPKGGGNYMVGKPYKIAGQTYYPAEKPYAAVGSASWYGSDFHGRRTANGEDFRPRIDFAPPIRRCRSRVMRGSLICQDPLHRRARERSRALSRGSGHGRIAAGRRGAGFPFRGTARVKVEWIGRANLAGDDDAKLLATLRDDGEPAALDGAAPVMVARARSRSASAMLSVAAPTRRPAPKPKRCPMPRRKAGPNRSPKTRAPPARGPGGAGRSVDRRKGEAKTCRASAADASGLLGGTRRPRFRRRRRDRP